MVGVAYESYCTSFISSFNDIWLSEICMGNNPGAVASQLKSGTSMHFPHFLSIQATPLTVSSVAHTNSLAMTPVWQPSTPAYLEKERGGWGGEKKGGRKEDERGQQHFNRNALPQQRV